MQFKENSRNSTSLLAKVDFIVHNETVHFCIPIALVLICFLLNIADIRLKHVSARNKNTVGEDQAVILF